MQKYCLVLFCTLNTEWKWKWIMNVYWQDCCKFEIFWFGAILPLYIHNSLSLSFSVQYTEQNQAILLHELHWQSMHVQISSRFYKVLQNSSKVGLELFTLSDFNSRWTNQVLKAGARFFKRERCQPNIDFVNVFNIFIHIYLLLFLVVSKSPATTCCSLLPSLSWKETTV